MAAAEFEGGTFPRLAQKKGEPGHRADYFVIAANSRSLDFAPAKPGAPLG